MSLWHSSTNQSILTFDHDLALFFITLLRYIRLSKISMSLPRTWTDCFVSFSKPTNTCTLVLAKEDYNTNGFSSFHSATRVINKVSSDSLNIQHQNSCYCRQTIHNLPNTQTIQVLKSGGVRTKPGSLTFIRKKLEKPPPSTPQNILSTRVKASQYNIILAGIPRRCKTTQSASWYTVKKGFLISIWLHAFSIKTHVSALWVLGFS